jgi:glyoxylase I family protein
VPFAAVLVQSEVMFSGVEHTAIASPEPARLAQWYVDHLGFRINYEYGGNYFVKAPNGTMLEIIPSEGERAPQNMRDPGIRHLAIAVDDFDLAHQQLKTKNVTFLGEPYETQGNRLVFFADGDGNFVHLIHRARPLP